MKTVIATNQNISSGGNFFHQGIGNMTFQNSVKSGEPDNEDWKDIAHELQRKLDREETISELLLKLFRAVIKKIG